ncbi:class I SAM-dependent methyltransferase [Methanobacterium spitsbergense]|uniref:Methyltransferase domain-containing protein n=1 Tax=Methanobacterium spitsbergense TaxID=2874285 RepID=A0A8T5V414_9EURY|nr:methyltransferase domain-containing protein [Methanobacterium spitsbergense]MBZ2166611.1 methyltransferase domain-containing protein [Methanobacterium spitsbergense]
MFKWDAEEYQKSSSAQQKWARELITKMDLQGSEVVLDIGCGDGKVTSEIATHLKDGCIMGIDSSIDMIELATRTFPLKKHPNLHFKLKDFQEIDYNSKFDIIFSNAALHWIKGHEDILKRIQKSLKPDGRILIQMGGKGNAQKILDLADEIITKEKWNNYFQGFTFPYGFYGPKKYIKWLNEANLKPVRVELISKVMVQKGFKGLKSWIRTVWLPYTQRIPEDLREDFINELATRYIEQYPLDNEGMVHVNMVRLEVEAFKG